MDFPHGEFVTLVSVTTAGDDGLGNVTESTVETSWGPCAVWDRFASESSDSRSAPVVVGLTIAGPRVALGAVDRIKRAGLVYEVDGEPQENTVSPFTGWDPGIVVNVKRAGS